MKSYDAHDAMKEAAGEQKSSLVAEIADRLHLKPSTVYKWTQPSEDPTDSGSRGPLKTLLQYMESCLVLGRPREAALSPLAYLNHHFSQVCFSVPDHVKAMRREDLTKELLHCIAEAGKVVKDYEAVLKNNHVSRDELRRIEKQVWETVTDFMIFLHCLKEAGK